MGEWINVENRLPEDGKDCMAYMQDRGTVILCHYNKDFSLVLCGAEGFAEHGVTHWMPLPDPPEDK